MIEETKSYLQVGVKVLLRNPQKKFLLVRRNSEKYPEIGPKWDIVGGRIDIGLPLLDNLNREVKEEVGLRIISNPTHCSSGYFKYTGVSRSSRGTINLYS